MLSGINYTVDALTDTGTGAGLAGDLRYAINNANANPGSTITISASGTVNLVSALPDLSANVDITDPTPGSFVVNGGGSSTNYRALAIDSGVTASITGVVFTNFYTTSNGGILYIDGNLTLDDVTLENSKGNAGGAVFISTSGTLTAFDSTFAGNTSPSSGGGAIFNYNVLNLFGGSVTGNSADTGGGVFDNGFADIAGVYIGSNTANNSGGIYAGEGPQSSGLRLTNSTITGNSSTTNGGGVGVYYNNAVLTNVTIVGNTSPAGSTGAGIYINTNIAPILYNTLIAGNNAGSTESDVDGSGTINAASRYNLLGNASVSGIGNGSQGNQIGTSLSPINAGLASLADNGGGTRTFALVPGSPAFSGGLAAYAVDPVTSNPLLYDQRGVGFSRADGSVVDVGAFEVQTIPTSLAVSSASGTYGGTTTLTATLTSGGSPVSNQLVDFHIGAIDFGTATTDTNGVATLSGVFLTSIHAGTYSGDVTASFVRNPTYGGSSGTSDLTVTPAPLTIIANNQSKVYGSALPTLTASYTGFVNGDTAASLTTLPTLSTTATAASHVAGSPYSITASGAVDSDYAISYVAGSLSVTTAPLTVTANNQSKVYGSALPTLTASYTGFVNGDTPASLSTPTTISTSATAASHVAGSPYSITASGAVDSDYAISYVAGSLSVTAAPMTITANNQSKVYGSALPTLTASYTGFVNGDTSLSLTTLPTLSTTATAASHVAGSPYSITASGAVDSDYAISYVVGALAVTPATLTVTANNQTKVYGAALPTLTASYSGFVNGDTVASLGTAASLTTTADFHSDVAGGPYAVNAGGAVDADYTIGYVPGALTVTQAPLTVAANNLSKVYGQANPTLAGTVAGVVAGDDVQAAFATTATASSGVKAGGYPITFAGLTGTKAANYSTTVGGGSAVSGTLTVTPAPLTVIANNASKVYGSANPALSGAIHGVLTGDQVAVGYVTTADATSHVAAGGYAITATALSGPQASNYAISQVAPGALTITPAPLTIAVANAAKVYGQPNPTFSASYAGFVLGQNASVLGGVAGFSTTATGQSHVGNYPVTPNGATSNDYAIRFVSGNLGVTPAALVITPVDASKDFGLPLPTLTASYQGFVNGDSPASLARPVSLSTTATAQSAVGSYPITASGAASADYAVRYGVGALTVAAPTNRFNFLTVLYNDILGRGVEPSGAVFWLQRIASGSTPRSIFQQIYGSAEAVALRARHHAPAISPVRIFTLALRALNAKR